MTSTFFFATAGAGAGLGSAAGGFFGFFAIADLFCRWDMTYGAGDDRATARTRLNVQCSADHSGTICHGMHPNSSAAEICLGEADTVVADFQHQSTIRQQG
jgi:hypothetical protein